MLADASAADFDKKPPVFLRVGIKAFNEIIWVRLDYVGRLGKNTVKFPFRESNAAKATANEVVKMNRKISQFLMVLAVATVTVSQFAQAAADGDSAGWVGGQFGISVPNYSNMTSRTGYGISAGAKVGSVFGVGGYCSSSHKDESIANVTQPFNYDLYGVMAGYFFEGEARGVYVGGMLGMTKVSFNANNASASTSPMHYGVVAGYDYLLMSHLSLGGEISYVSIASSTATTTLGATASQDAFATLNFNAALKFWF
jgi:Outer membrane protein beta-barrel domain